MTFQIPPWAPAGPVALPVTDGEGGRVVAVVAGQGAVTAGWAADLTAELARGWADAGARVVLADGGLTHPQLHESLSLPPEEGLSDALLWGASMKRVAVRPEGEPFFAVTAGTAVADGAAVFLGERWGALCAGFREAGVTLAVLVPADDPCVAGVLAQATDVVVVAARGEDLSGLLAGVGAPVHAVVGRPSEGDAEEAPADVPGPEDVAAEPWGLEELAPGPAESTEPVAATPFGTGGVEGDGGAPEGAQPGSEDVEVADPDPLDLGAPEPDTGEPESGEPEPEAGAEIVADLDGEPVDDPTFDPLDLSAIQEVPDEADAPEGGEAGAAYGDPLAFMGEGGEWETPFSSAPAPGDGVGSGEASSEEGGWGDPPQEEGWSDPLEGGRASSDPLMEGHGGRGKAAAEDFLTPEPEEVEAYDSRPVPTFEEIVEDAEAPYLPPERSGSGGRARVLLLVLLLVVVGVVAAAWFGYVEIPGITPQATGATEATLPAAAVPTLAAGPATEVPEPVAFSLALGAFQDPDAATEMVSDLSERVPGVLFVAVPVDVQGTVMHRVLAGPATDSAAAVALADRVGQSAGLDPAGWVARWTPRAFQLGEMADLEAARRRAGVLTGMGVPAYVLAVPFSDGSLRFRVYAGAYADASEASYLSGLLDERGLSSASLSERTGHLPE